jgi:iron only hydrogenase large subunit-like protein/uncharacterized Fe-S cluster-containing protein
MINQKPIYTVENDCMDCYKCVRNCPSKAIKITEHKSSIIDELCIYCGKCVSICPAGAKHIRDGVTRVKHLIKSGVPTIASIAPSFRADFHHLNDQEFIQRLYNLGFNYVSETALGAQIVTAHTQQFLEARNKGIYISSACPGVVELIKKYYPKYVVNIIPFLSPMLAHAKSLKKLVNKEYKTIFIGPCVAKKAEADKWPGLVDTAITFKELKDWMDEPCNQDKQKSENKNHQQFYPFEANNGKLYAIEGGMINSFTPNSTSHVLKLHFSGIDQIKKVLDGLDTIEHDAPVFLELLLCEGGCVNGPGCHSENNPVKNKIDILFSKPIKPTKQQELPVHLNIECDYFGSKPIKLPHYSPAAIQEALNNIGKTRSEDELNCGSCGYNTCREFAVATLNGMAESNMCVSHLRKIAHNQTSILLKKIPSGVILVNSQLKITEINESFTRMLGYNNSEDHTPIFNSKEMDIEDLGYFTEHFKTAIHTGKEYNQIHITQNGKNFQLSIFNIQKFKLIAGIIQDFESKEFKADIIENRTRDVIKKNMETVQKIAALLGENASYTNSLLNSILSDFTKKSNEKIISE